MTFSNASAAVTNIDNSADRRFKRKLWTGKARHKDRAMEIKLDGEAREVLAELVQWHGMLWMTQQLGLSERTVWKLIAGFGESCRAEKQQAAKRFLAGYAR